MSVRMGVKEGFKRVALCTHVYMQHRLAGIGPVTPRLGCTIKGLIMER